MPTVWEQIGGLPGLLYSSIPTTVFVVVNSQFGLTAGIWAALAVAALFIVVRAVRKEPLRPAISSLVGIAISSYIAYASGSTRGYFLTDIWWAAGSFLVLAASILIRRPLVGVAWSAMNRLPMAWKKDRKARFGYDLATGALAVVFGSRFLVLNYFYDKDSTGWLAVTKIAMGWPLTGLALIIALWAIRRADKRVKFVQAQEKLRAERQQSSAPTGYQ
jgi:hypothetical protein